MNIYVDANWDGASAAPAGYDKICANLTDAVKAASTTEATTITVAAGTYGDSIGFYKNNIPADTPKLSSAVKDICELCEAVGEQKGDIVIKAADGADVIFTGHFLIGSNSRGTSGVGAQHWDADVKFEGITFDAAETQKHSVVIADVNGFSMEKCTIIGDGDGYGVGSPTNSSYETAPVFKDCNFQKATIQGEAQLGAKLVVDGGTFVDSQINAPGGLNDTCMTITGATFQNTITEEGDFYVVRSNAYPVNISDCSFDLKIAEGVDASKVSGGVFVPRKGGDMAWNVESVAVTFDEAALNASSIYLSQTLNGGDRMVIIGLTSTSNDVADLLAKTSGDLTVKQGDLSISYKDGEVNMPAFDGDENKVICNLEDLKKFRDMVNDGTTFSGETITLAADIDLNNEEWTPIGSNGGFYGTFDGGNHTISNLFVSGNNKYVGLFGKTYSGEIKNLTIENAKVSGYLGVGVVAGMPYTSKYTNITVTGHVEVSGMSYVGGVGGRNAYANWTNITVDVDDTSFVKADSVENGTAYRTYVGGVIGFIGEGGHTFKNIYSNINVTGTVCDIGGIAGIGHYNNNFENIVCEAGKIESTSTEPDVAGQVGGILGVWNNDPVRDNKGNFVSLTTVSMSNCVIDDKTVVKVNGKDVTDKHGISGDAYTTNEDQTELGSLCIAKEVKDENGNTKLEYSVVGGLADNAKDALESFVTEVQPETEATDSLITYDEKTGTYSYTAPETIVAKVDGKYYTDYATAADAAEKANSEAVGLYKAIEGVIYVNNTFSTQDAINAVYGPNSGVELNTNAFASYNNALNAATDGMTILVSGSLTQAQIFVGQTDSDVDVTVVFDGANVNQWSENFRIDNGSTANVIGNSTIQYASMPVRGTLNVGSADGKTGTVTGKGFNVYGEADGDNTAVVNVYAGSTLSANDGAQNPSFVGHYSADDRKGELNIYGGLVNASYLKVNKAGVVNIVMDAEDWSDGVDNVNLDSKKITGEGKIIVDATKFAGGVDKIIDSDTDGGIAVEFKNGTTKDGVYMTKSEDGDVFVADVKKDIVYVDNSFTGEFGKKVGEGKYLGFNAFADLNSAVAAAENEATIIVSGDEVIVSKAALNGKNVTITGTAVFDWEKGSIMVGQNSVGENEIATLTFENAKISTIESNKGVAMSGGINIRTPKNDNKAFKI